MSDPHRGRLSLRGDAAKRAFDLLVASALVVLLSPVILAVAVAVRLKLGSPVLFTQQRPGLHGRPFRIYKFRSMRDATDASGRVLDDTERTPPFGRRLRSTSLDELPELWNVIRGDMSLVGPRPLLTHYMSRYTADQARRHDVRPGITGLAQVGGRNALTWDEKFALDLEYVDCHDLRLDLDILARTVQVVVRREGTRHGAADQDDMPEFMGSETSPGGLDDRS